MAQTLTPFNGVLNSNEIYSAIYNMLISQTVFASPIKKTFGLAEKFKKDGSLYGDTKLFYSVQIGKVIDWTNDSEAANLLNLNRPAAPYCQGVTIDVFKMVWLTVDNFLSKRAWGDESSFSQFNSVVLATIRDTKRVYEATYVNAFIGTYATETGKQTVTVSVPSNNGITNGVTDEVPPVTTTYTLGDKEAINRLEAQTIAQAIADTLVNVEDVTTLFNDLGYLRSYDKAELMFIVSSKWANKITKVDLPTIFNAEGLADKLTENVIPARYFGVQLSESNYSTYSASTPTPGKPIDSDDGKYTPGVGNANGTVRALLEQDVTVSGTTTHLRPGDELPSGAVVYDSTAAAGSKVKIPCYIEDEKIVCKIVVPEAIQYMSAFETQTEFYNPRSLTNSHYLIFGHSNLEKSVLKEFPYITIKTA